MNVDRNRSSFIFNHRKFFGLVSCLNLCVWGAPSDSSWWKKVLLDESRRLIGPLLSWMNWLCIHIEECNYILINAALAVRNYRDSTGHNCVISWRYITFTIAEPIDAQSHVSLSFSSRTDHFIYEHIYCVYLFWKLRPQCVKLSLPSTLSWPSIGGWESSVRRLEVCGGLTCCELEVLLLLSILGW